MVETDVIWQPDEGERVTHNSLRIIQEAGKKLVAEKKAAVLAEKSSAEEIQEKDILSLLSRWCIPILSFKLTEPFSS
jgi:hypothetical protein